MRLDFPRRRPLLAFALLLHGVFALGCATLYGRSGFAGGYYERQMGESDIFKVTFSGNGYTGKGRTADYALYRAAQVAVLHDHRYFEIIDEQIAHDRSEIQHPGHATSTTTFNTWGGSTTAQTTTVYTPPSTTTINKYSTTYYIRLLADPADATGEIYYDSAKVFRLLESDINWRGPHEREFAEAVASRVGE